MTVSTKRRVGGLLMVAVMLVSMAAMPAMAAVDYDDETTNTATTSDLLDGDTVTDLDNSSIVKTIEVTSDNASSGDDLALEVAVNDSDSSQDGETIYESDESWTVTDETNGHYSLNITHSEVFETLERGAGETVTVDVTTIVNESEDTEESETIQVDAQNDDDSAVAAVYGDEDGTELADKTGFASFSVSSLAFWSNSSDSSDEFTGAAQATETTNVSDNTSTVRVELLNSSTSDAGSSALGDAGAGSFLGTAAASVGGDLVPVFSESASDVSWVDTSSDTYATIDSEGDTVTVHNVNETVDESGEVDVSTTLNDAVGFGETRSMLSNYGDLSFTQRFSMAFDAMDLNGDAFGGSLL